MKSHVYLERSVRPTQNMDASPANLIQLVLSQANK